jgi:penicillin-binding protein 1C
MQLAARIDAHLSPPAGRRSLAQKLRQIGAACALERRWSKQEILEAYLNLISFRGELQGIAAASAGLFGKRPHGLNDVESVILAALIRAPNARSGQVAARALQLAHAMLLPVQDSHVTAAAHQALDRPYRIQPETTLAPHVALRLAGPGGPGGATPARIACTLDAGLQRFVLDVLRRHIAALSSQNVRDGAVLLADNRSGEVLAYVGNTGETASARHVDGVRARRQAGSTLKPVIYGVAFERRLLTPASLLEDSPLDIPVPGGVYRPRNYDNRFHGLVTARTALASSLNVPAVKALGLVGVDEAVARLGCFGIGNLQSADFYGPSLALGSLDVTLWELVNVYRTFANGGLATDLRLSPTQPPAAPRRVLSPDAAFLLSDILSERESRAVTFSLESPLATSFWTAVKTGTSKDMRDNWCVGYSNLFTAGIWVGNFSGEPMWDVSGITGAAPVWLEIMSHLHRDKPSRAPETPAGVAAGEVTLLSGERRREWFLAGTETRRVQPASRHAPARIAYPAAGTVIALDPDIPQEQQKVFFEAESGNNALSWILDGHMVGPANSTYLWTPSLGRHSLELAGAGNKIQDSITFEVRGSNP